MIRQGAIALLGRADKPTDGVEEYCNHLGEALRGRGISLAIERVAWEKRGWRRALRSLRRHARAWKDSWVLVQYTALAWSARGFPLRFWRVLRILNRVGSRIAVVYHDVEPFTGPRLIDRLRHSAQLHAMRQAMDACEVAVFTVPMEKLSLHALRFHSRGGESSRSRTGCFPKEGRERWEVEHSGFQCHRRRLPATGSRRHHPRRSLRCFAPEKSKVDCFRPPFGRCGKRIPQTAGRRSRGDSSVGLTFR